MKNIDFLPTKYREGYAARSAVVRRWTIMLGLLATVAPLAVYQYAQHRRVVLSLAAIEPDYVQAQDQVRQLDQIQKELQLARDEAMLVAYLSHPWPRTQVLEQVRSILPDAVRLTHITVQLEPKQGSPGVISPGRNRASRRGGEVADTKGDDQLSPAQRDLKQLTEHLQQHDAIVVLQGVTIDTTDLHTYVAKLRVSGLFAKSELKSLESVANLESERAQKFEIRLALSPGHSQFPKAKVASEPSPGVAAMGLNSKIEMAKHP